MSKETSRRDLFSTVGIGAMAVGAGLAAGRAEAQSGGPPTGPLSQATVTFGAWKTDTGIDFFTGPPGPSDNEHTLAPNEVTIKAGGSVSFVLSGFHNVQIYDNGTQPFNINTSLLTVGPDAPPGVPPIFIDDPNGRIYRGPSPFSAPGDRVESVTFPNPGTFLVLCGLIFHFNDEMWGFVRVLP